MNISAFKIFIIFVLLTVLGVFVLPLISVKLNPSKIAPSITVNYNWANASPLAIEKNLTSVLEAGFSTLKGIKELKSKSAKGIGYITLEFDKHINLEFARFETATIIRRLHKQLPEQASYPSISVNSPDENTGAFLTYSINASALPIDIQETANTQVAPIINAVQGIDKALVHGANKKEYVLSYSHNNLRLLKLTKQDVLDALQRAFQKETLGEINYNKQYITLSIQPEKNIIDWHIPVKKIGDRLLYLDDLATIKSIEQEAQSYYRVNGRNAITLSLHATKNANTISLSRKIDQLLLEIQNQLPESYSITKVFDSTEYLVQELNKIYMRTTYTVAILLFFILLISRSFKYLLITSISLIANISIAFLLYYFLKIEIQLYSLAGITISLGLIIDNSIVMIDHIKHQHNKNIFIPVLASTLTTLGALSIIYFLDDVYKVNLIDFALVIIINLSVSLATALFLIPALVEKITLPIKTTWSASQKLKDRFYSIYKSIITIQLRFKKTAIFFIILLFGTPIFMLPDKLERDTTWFEKKYNLVLGNDWYIETIKPYVDKYLGGSFRLFSEYVFNESFYRTNQETKLYITTSMEKGATVHQMNAVFLDLEVFLRQFKEIKQYITNVYSNNYGQIEITFSPKAESSSFPSILKSHIIRKILDYGAMNWNVYGVGNGFSSSNNTNDPIDFSVEAKGYNYDQLNSWADSLKKALETNPRVQNVVVKENNKHSKIPSYAYRFSLDKEQLAIVNTTPSIILNELQDLTLSKQASTSLNIQGEYMPVRFESKESKHFDIWHINNTPLDSLRNPVILKNIASINKELEEENIYKENQEFVRLVVFQYVGALQFGAAFLGKKLRAFENKLPLGYSFEPDNRRVLLSDDKNNNYIFLLLLIMGIIYFICAILFENFKQPFIILSIIPISFIGVFLSFYLFDFNFDQGGLASFVLLSGITVNASIFIIDSFNKLKKAFPKKDKIDLYIEAFKQKIFPIMLTILSTILGFIPFVKDGQNEVFWFALGAGTIGGLVFSLVGILFYLPIFTLKQNQNST